MARVGRGIGAVLVALLLAVAWVERRGSDRTTDPRPPWATCAAPSVHAVPGAVPVDAPARIVLEPVADLEQPTATVPVAGGALLVTLRERGIVRVDRAGKVTEVLDLTGDLSLDGERGVLGLAAQPDGRAAFVAYTAEDGDFTIARVPLPVGGGEGSAETILRYPDAHRFHNGGGLAFGPDGMLYVGLGDGGDEYEGDPEGDSQSLSSLFGSILRIDVTSKPGEYVVPDDNPFVAHDGARGEIWAYGLRNPWRFAFDVDAGDLWVADVGQFCWEEINRIPAARAGANFGWNRFEGGYEFEPGAGDPVAVVWPLHQYPHAYGAGPGDRDACAVIGGRVYRGGALPALEGWYLYSDFCAGKIQALRATPRGQLEIAELGESPAPVVSFAVDHAGELLLVTTEGLQRMAPDPRPTDL